jgi:hypothetical protein
VSRGLRQQQASNAHQAEHEEFVAMLLAALEDPDVAEAVAAVATRHRPPRPKRTGMTVTSATAARQLKQDRLAARGRGTRG